jgi:hypothetical protein
VSAPEESGLRSVGGSPISAGARHQYGQLHRNPILSMHTKSLNPAEIEAMNLEYGLDLSYDNATHYRAAQVIYSLTKSLKAPDRAAGHVADSPASAPVPSSTSLSYPSLSDDTDD